MVDSYNLVRILSQVKLDFDYAFHFKFILIYKKLIAFILISLIDLLHLQVSANLVDYYPIIIFQTIFKFFFRAF